MPARSPKTARALAFLLALAALGAGLFALLHGRPAETSGAGGLTGRSVAAAAEPFGGTRLIGATSSGTATPRTLGQLGSGGSHGASSVARTVRVRVVAPDAEPPAAGDEVVLLGSSRDLHDVRRSPVSPFRSVVPRGHPSIRARKPLAFDTVLEFPIEWDVAYAGFGLVSENLTVDLVPVPSGSDEVLVLEPRRAEDVYVELVLPDGAHPSVRDTVARAHLQVSIRAAGAPVPVLSSRDMLLADTLQPRGRTPSDPNGETVFLTHFGNDLADEIRAVPSDAAIFVTSQALGLVRGVNALEHLRAGDPVVPTTVRGYHDGRRDGGRVVRVELDFAPTFVLNAVDENGAAHAEGTVALTFTGRHDEVRPTGGPGAFAVRFGRAPHPGIVVRAPGADEAAVEIPPGIDTSTVVDLGAIPLESAAPLQGRVLHADGTPAADFEVLADRVFSWTGRAAHSTRTDTEGRFTLRPPRGEGLLLYGHDLGSAPGEAFGPLRVGPERAPVEIVLEPLPVLELHVRRPWGPENGRVVLQLRPAGPRGPATAHRFGSRQWSVAPVDGRVEILDLRPGHWTLTVATPYSGSATIEFDLDSGRTVRTVEIEAPPNVVPTGTSR